MSSRRDFIATAGFAGAAAILPTAVHAAGNATIKVGVIGCGGRGTQAAENALDADPDVKIVALGDIDIGQSKRAAGTLTKRNKERVDFTDRVFGGLDAFKQVLAQELDYVILATPPGFRPVHLEAAVKAKKNIFCEKPVAVDIPGIKTCLSLVDQVTANKTALVAGTQRRHQAGYLETMKRIHDGEIGDIVSARCAWNGQNIWFKPRKPGESDVAYQCRNWYHFLWVCGDHIVEQHVHNLDVINWALKGHPVKAVGFGGRTAGNPSRPAGPTNESGHIWDHFAIEFEYPNGVHVSSYCTHLPGVKSDVSETVYGSKGSSRVNAYEIKKKRVYEEKREKEISPYVQEHIDLIKSIRAGKPLNELQSVTESTATAIMGRNAAYSGQVVTWESLMKSTASTMPEGLTIDTKIEVPPVPAPGKFKF